MISHVPGCQSFGKLAWGGLCICLVLAVGLPAAAQENDQGQPEAAGSVSDLPLQKVVLFNSGVGFFEHQSQIEGDAQIDLKFNVDSVNDLLKSMVLQDFGGGRISTVTYESHDPITKTLRTFAIDLTNNPSLAELLNQMRGERVEIESPNVIQGVIVGVERRRRPAGKGDEEVVEVEVLNLLTDNGLRSVPLDTVGRIAFEDDKLNAEFRQALEVLAMGHATDKKTVTLHFLGNGRRPVRVGYIQQTPIWKTSYRLVLEEDEAPFLQGWAIVENTTEQDWKDVALTLVSGRPVSFIMDLYQPLYVPRPVVEPELFASLRPQTYGQDLAEKEAEFRQLDRDAAPAEGQRDALRARRAAKAPAEALARGAVSEEAKAAMAGLDLAQGVQSVAQAGDVGELFQYVIDTPVTLPRQQSAMLPIVNGSVQGAKLVIYNPSVHAKHPLNGLRLTNSTGLHLMQGPITVFDGGAYAGDARIEDLPPGSERLISYALDLDTEVAIESRPSPDRLTQVRLAKGTLYATRKFKRGQEYTVKNSGSKPKDALIEYPIDPSWTLVNPKEPTEKTRDLYRFALVAEPGKPEKLKVEEEMTQTEQVALTNLDIGTIVFYVESRAVSDKVKQALSEIVKRRQAIDELAAQRQQLEQQIAVIDAEQARIRQNMEQLARDSDLYRRYVQKFSDQEDQVEGLREQIEKLTTEEQEKRESLDEYILSLEVE